MPRRTPSWLASAAGIWVRMERALGLGRRPVPVVAAGVPTQPVVEPRYRKVTLRADRTGTDYRHLEAYVDGEGRLHVDGQDLGPGTSIVSSDGEYEWFETIAAADVPQVVALLGGQEGDDILDVLERDFTGPKSYDFEARMRSSGIARNLHTWNG